MQQQTSVADIARRIDELAQRLEKEWFLTTVGPERLSQNQQLGRLRTDVKQIIYDIVVLLKMPKLSDTAVGRWIAHLLHWWAFTGINRDNLCIHLVNAALLQLQIQLLIIRVDANRTWLDQSIDLPNRRYEVRLATNHFRRTLHNAPVSLSALNLHTIASALRSWSDELSVSATKISGWLEAAIPVSRDLRFLANRYHTQWLWKTVLDIHTHATLPARCLIFARAAFDTAFGWLSGYGLKGRRFIVSLGLIIFSYAAAFDAVDILNGCQPWWSLHNVWTYVLLSAAYLVNNGTVSVHEQVIAACPGTGSTVLVIGILESGSGYLMLGILVSLLWSAIQQRSIDTSQLVIPSSRRSDARQEQLQFGMQKVRTAVDSPEHNDTGSELT